MRLTELSVFRNDRSNCRDAALTPPGLSGVASHAANTRGPASDEKRVGVDATPKNLSSPSRHSAISSDESAVVTVAVYLLCAQHIGCPLD